MSVSPKERISAFLAGEATDAVPCVPLVLNHAARVLGVPLGEAAVDGELMGRAHVAAYRRFGQDMITLFVDTAVNAEAMGTRLRFPADGVPRFEAPAVADPADADALEVPDARTAGRLPALLEAVRHSVREVGDEVFVACCIPAAFSTAAALRGTDQFARDLIRHPDAARTLIEKADRLVLDFCDACAEAGGIPAIVDPVASGSVISRRQFEAFALPALTNEMARIRDLGYPPILHICGRSSSIVDLMADSGAAVLSLDVIDLAEARERVGDRVCLMGNVHSAQVMMNGTPDGVRDAARRCLEAAGDNPAGYILATGCEVPADTPFENVEALVEVARTARVH